MLIERLFHFRTEDEQILGKAALYALEYLDKIDQSSPYIEQLIQRLDALPRNDIIAKFQDPQWNITIQNSKAKKLKSICNENFYHETDIKRTLEVAELYTFNKQYLEASNVLSTSAMGSPTCQLAEYAAQIALLQGNYPGVLNQDKRVEAFLTTSTSNELYLKRLTDQEVTSYWRVKYLILIASFLKQDFAEVSSLIYDLVDAPSIQTASGKQLSALQILKDSNFGKFIHEDEIVLASFISILMHKSPKELNNVLNDTEFTTLLGPKLVETRPFFISLNTAKFKEFNTLLDGLDTIALSNLFFSKIWPQIRLKFRQKGYGLYLKLAVKVSAEHLSKRLDMPKAELIKEVNDYIKEKSLEISFDSEREIFEIKKVDKRLAFAETLQKLCEDTDNTESALREKLDSVQNKAIRAKNAITIRRQE